MNTPFVAALIFIVLYCRIEQLLEIIKTNDTEMSDNQGIRGVVIVQGVWLLG